MPWTVTQRVKYHSRHAGKEETWEDVFSHTASYAGFAESLAVQTASQVIACDDERFDGNGTPVSTIIEITWIEEN